VFGVVAVGLIVWAAIRHASIADLGLLSIAATPLMLPYIFNYDLVALSFVALVWSARSPAPRWSPERAAYGACFLVPLLQVPLAEAGIWISPLLILAAMGFAAWRLARAGQPSAVAASQQP